jgi:hypothetical protein
MPLIYGSTFDRQCLCYRHIKLTIIQALHIVLCTGASSLQYAAGTNTQHTTFIQKGPDPLWTDTYNAILLGFPHLWLICNCNLLFTYYRHFNHVLVFYSQGLH